ncbi:Fis family transcriptional regulator [Oceanobacillus sp. E9]|uniref:sigma-54 interaction domain-containing protein n=1 Tax=Oceanobacillus TaxID=182709 RepID=UPI00084E8B3B|nr:MULTISPECIES: sigma 54-interacting transcriptional regulator [Oceanobacillus]OEH54815.1 Fis family transcriptional regulator [Oceanobacillus sp. E9]
MQLTFNERLLEEYGVPFLILNKNNQVLLYHIDSVKEENIIIGKNIMELFSVWKETTSSEFIHAEYEDKVFVFIKVASILNNRLLIGVETPEINDLIKEIKKIKNLNRELDAIIENSYDGIYITDSKGVTLKTNSAIERITGIPKEYYIGKNVNALIERGILKNSVTNKVLELNRTVTLVQINYAGNQTLLTGSPVYNEKGEIEKVVTNIRDLSDLYELQTELLRVNKLNDKFKKELERLKNRPDQLKDVITKSEQMKLIYDTAQRIANIDATVLILGETGVGKDVLANYIYSNSERSKKGEFMKVNCGAIPSDLLESELFGYESGAFTGANSQGKKGMFELADKGTIFLDEIGELPLPLQVKLLRVLQDGEIHRIGGTKPQKIDTRIITATNRDLRSMVENGEFREDLYYRLNVIPIKIPPLRERRDDIIPMIHYFLEKMNKKYNLNKTIDYNLKSFFLSYDWSGNIRELSNLIERLVVTTRDELISIDNLPVEYITSKEYTTNQLVSLKAAVEIAEKKVLSLAAEKYTSTYEIAKALESSQPTIVRKLKKYKMDIKNN